MILLLTFSKNKSNNETANDIFFNTHNTEKDWILIAKDIPITELTQLSKKGVLAFAIELGSPTSHIAILSRSLGIPLKERHRASGDALATVELLKILIEKELKH